ncbi:hypothetical protein TNCV_1323501 [Trichonephila clavipes]|nr:hypothetical protein TNCV_1323501 [Trichonephila clavipes]
MGMPPLDVICSPEKLTHDRIYLINRVDAVQRTCILQWIPTHEDPFGNEPADNFAKEARNFPQLSNSLTHTDTDGITRRKLTSHPVKTPFTSDLNCNRVISITIARLRTP